MKFTKNIVKVTMLLAICFMSGIGVSQDLGVLFPNGSGDTNASKAEKIIPLETTAVEDDAIEKRLRELYRDREKLKDVAFGVESGLVTLSGSVLTKIAKESAAEQAAQIDGVVSVNNDIEVVKDVNDRLHYVFENLQTRVYGIIASFPLFFVAAVVVLIFWLLARWIISVDSIFSRFSKNVFISDLAKQVTQGVMVIIGFIIALEILDATGLLGSLMGAVGLFGLAIGFAIRDTVENYIASILLSLKQPFAPNDHIIIEGYEGKVVRLTSRATILMTFDGNHIRVPNAVVYKGILTNYSRNPERRFEFDVGVDNDVDLTAARALAIRTIKEVEGVSASPTPSCQIQTLGDSNVVLTVYGWTNQSSYDFLKVRSAGIHAVKEAFDAAEFEMPEPIYRLRIQGLNNGLIVQQPDKKKDVELQNTKPRSSSKPPTIEHSDVKEVNDVSKDHELDREIAREAASEYDLLDDSAVKE